MNEKKKPALVKQAEDNGNDNDKAQSVKNQVEITIEKEGVKLPLVNAEDLLAQDPPPPPTDFVIGGLPAKQLGLLVGSDGAGKSMLALQMAVGVACGIGVAGGAIPAPMPGKVIYVSGEDDTDYLYKRLSILKNNITQYQNINLSNLDILALDGMMLPLASVANGKVIDNLKNINEFKKLMDDTRLLIIDPLVMFHELEENNNSHMNYLARLLIKLARQTDCTIIAVHHTGQEAIINSRDDHQAGRGATALAAAARAVWVLRRLDKAEKNKYKNNNPLTLRILRGSKVSRMAETDGVMLRLDDDSVLDKTEILLDNHKGGYRDEEETR